MIETQRLRLEPLVVSHAEEMFGVLSDERIYTYLPTDPPASLDALRESYEFLAKGESPDGRERWLNWILISRAEERALGFFQATVREPESCKIAYILNPRQQGTGHAREASLALISHLFDTYDIPAVEAFIDTRNEPSIRLVRALGLVRARSIHGADEFKGARSDEFVYRVAREDWRPDA
jgi:RimJ/RimL family protein N-acetyltransferase